MTRPFGWSTNDDQWRRGRSLNNNRTHQKKTKGLELPICWLRPRNWPPSITAKKREQNRENEGENEEKKRNETKTGPDRPSSSTIGRGQTTSTRRCRAFFFLPPPKRCETITGPQTTTTPPPPTTTTTTNTQQQNVLFLSNTPTPTFLGPSHWSSTRVLPHLGYFWSLLDAVFCCCCCCCCCCCKFPSRSSLILWWGPRAITGRRCIMDRTGWRHLHGVGVAIYCRSTTITHPQQQRGKKKRKKRKKFQPKPQHQPGWFGLLPRWFIVLRRCRFDCLITSFSTAWWASIKAVDLFSYYRGADWLLEIKRTLTRTRGSAFAVLMRRNSFGICFFCYSVVEARFVLFFFVAASSWIDFGWVRTSLNDWIWADRFDRLPPRKASPVGQVFHVLLTRRCPVSAQFCRRRRRVCVCVCVRRSS